MGKEVLSYIRSACEVVAKHNKVDLIIAVTDEDFVLHGTENTDLTAEVLSELQRSYHNEFRRH